MLPIINNRSEEVIQQRNVKRVDENETSKSASIIENMFPIRFINKYF